MIVAVAAWRGRGATTTALLLAHELQRLAPHRGTVLVEADPAGGVLAARFGIRRDPLRGLEALAFPTGSGAETFEREVLEARVSAVVGDLPVVVAPGDPFHAWACHRPRVDWVGGLAGLDCAAVVDIGRLHGGTPVDCVIDTAAVLVLVTDDDAVSVAGAVEWMEGDGRMSPWDGRVGRREVRLVVVESGSPVGVVRPDDLVAAVGDGVPVYMPHSPRTARLIGCGASPGERRRRRDPLVAAASRLAAQVDGALVPAVTA